ncbi:MAG TPA: SDR family NAD(P)-dependent oxidoreductase [Dehalococcoidia bacterium]|nr:SDR family NAD(P)-dependent oxidoreductase [Dehalococcoidia bacterium]
MDLRLRGKRAIVTGAGVGIGRAIAAELAREGVSVAICARSAETLQAAAKEIEAETGSRVVPIAADMRDLADIGRFVDEAASALGGIDIVVNNAGASVRLSFAERPDEDWQDAMLLKFHGYVRVSRAALPHLERAGGGVILNIIGTGGKVYTEHHLAGGASNAALMLVTMGLATELGPQNIRVVAINPGAVLTPRWERSVARRAAARGVDPSVINEETARATPTHRITTAEDVADLAAYLVSDRARQVNGTIVTIDGGASKAL